tara:strand:+ start:50 stop:271 length:222 start_codon:yes stop_codon:yes gene_type:complete
MPLEFDQELSLADNLTRFREEAEQVDADCARILFDNLELLMRDGDATRTRHAVQEFNEAVLAALNDLPEEPVG